MGAIMRRTLATIFMFCSGYAYACEPNEVDVTLALVADVSTSMDEGEKEIQRIGYATAFEEGPVIDAILDGRCGRIAVTYIEFGTTPSTIVPWTVIDSDEASHAFAEAIRAAPPKTDSGMTGIARAMEYAADQISAAPWVAERLVMDVSADGQDNVTATVSSVRDKITTGTRENNWRQITVNGLIIHNTLPAYNMTQSDFSQWFRHNVVGGPGHFSIEIKGVNQIPEAVRRKLVLEIS